MSQTPLKLDKPPIVEAVVDIDCAMPPAFDIAGIEEKAKSALAGDYPVVKRRQIEQHRLARSKAGEPVTHTTSQSLQALQFSKPDTKQLVQVRLQGYSFNRLAPYSSLDEYLAEIKRTWSLFVAFAEPVQIRTVRLRYINRILLPLPAGKLLRLEEYIRTSPQFTSELDSKLVLTSFLQQYVARDVEANMDVSVVVTSQPPADQLLPIILDNSVAAPGPADPSNWPWINDKLEALRILKNQTFEDALTEKCLQLFQN